MVFQLTYASTAARPWTRAELVELLVSARERNSGAGITGMLLHRDGRFLQLLEGDEDDVRRLYATIAADPRHHEVATVSERRRVLRHFARWTMAFRDLGEEPIDVPGYADVLEDGVDPADGVVRDLVARLRPTGGTGGHPSRVLGPVGG